MAGKTTTELKAETEASAKKAGEMIDTLATPKATPTKAARKFKRFEITALQGKALPTHPELIEHEGETAYTDDAILANGMEQHGYKVTDTQPKAAKA